MNISEAEKATGLKRANIRFYEKCGLLSVSRNSANNYREYSDGDIQNLLKIKLLRCAGFTLEEIKKLILTDKGIGKIALKKAVELKKQLSDTETLLQICTVLGQSDKSFSEMDTNSYLINKELLDKRRDIIMSEDYDTISKKYDQFRAADKSNIDYLINEAGITSNMIVLDFGSGTGNHAIELKRRTGAVIYGVEPSDGMRENAVQKGSGVRFLKGDHKNIPLKNSSVDLIYMTDVIHHVPNLVIMFNEFARVLKPGGKVCIITESYKQIESRFWMRFFPTAITAEKERYPDVDDIIFIAESCGLKHIKTDVSDKRRKHKISKEFVELAENKGFSMFNLISETDYLTGLENLKIAYENGKIQDYTHGESFIWLKLDNI